MFIIRCKSKKLAIEFFKRFRSSKKKKTDIERFSDQNSKVVKIVDSSEVVKDITWENANLFDTVTNRKSQQNKKHVSEKNESDHKYYSKTSTSQNDTMECVSYFKSLDAQNFLFRNNLVIPSSNFNMGYVLNFPMLSLPNTEEEFSHGVPYLQELEKYSFPSVTTILSKTMPPENVAILERWKRRMISEMGEEGFKQYQKELFSTGSTFHQCIADYLLGIPENELRLKNEIIGHWDSLRTVLPAISNVKVLEKSVSHPYLFYRGIVDCVATYRNQLVVIDWKTSKKHKRTMSSIYDNPLQVAAYVGALNFDTTHNIKIDSALIVVAYENGDPGDVHYIPGPLCHVYWKEWLKRLKLYWDIMKKNQ